MSDFLEDAYFSQQPISVLATYDSTSTTSGALLTEGGLGVKLSAHIGEQLTVNSVNITPSLGDIVYERETVLTHNTSLPTIVPEFLFYNDITESFRAIVSVHVGNNNDSNLNKNAVYNLNGTLTPSGWNLNSSFTGDVTGVKFSIENDTINNRLAGTIMYINPNSDGTTTTIRFKANTISPPGASNDAEGYATIPTTLNAIDIDYTPNPTNWEAAPDSLQVAVDELATRMSNIKFKGQYYVSKDGNDTTGNGSIEKPYLTISAALTYATTNTQNTNEGVVINISPGQYSEDLLITKPNIVLKGNGHGSTKITRINGKVTITPASANGGVYSNYYSFENLCIASSANHVMAYTGSNTGYLYLKECMLVTSTAGVKGLVFTNTTSIKVNVFRCDINMSGSSNSSAVYIAPGSTVDGSFYNCNIYGKADPTISINGIGSSINFNHSYIDNNGPNVVELINAVVAYFSYCTIANSQTDSNGFNISAGTSLVLSHCIFNIPTGVSYPGSGTPPATTTGFAVKGTSGANVVYGSCLFAPVSVVNGTYYYGTKSISNTITPVLYNTTFSPQA